MIMHHDAHAHLTLALVVRLPRFGPIGVRVRVRIRVRDQVRARAWVRGELLPTTSHSIFYSRVGQIAIFSQCQP